MIGFEAICIVAILLVLGIVLSLLWKVNYVCSKMSTHLEQSTKMGFVLLRQAERERTQLVTRLEMLTDEMRNMNEKMVMLSAPESPHVLPKQGVKQ